MRKTIFHILAVAVLWAACCSLAQAQRGRSYVIGFYNLENLFDTYHDEGKNDQARTAPTSGRKPSMPGN